jgi:RNA methyltransferase, TrmH family
MPDSITSAANPLVKRVRLLADRKHRRREGAFVVEGIQPVWRAVEAGWQIETLLVCDELLSSEPARAMVAEQESGGTRVAHLSAGLFQRLSDRAGPPGLAAVVRCRSWSLADLTVTAGSVFAVLHEIANPGNLGTIVRTADAAGVDAVILTGEVTDQFAPASVKASMGSLFAVPVAVEPQVAAFFEWARAQGVQVCAASGRARTTHWQLPCPTPVAVLFGSEGDGLPPDVLARADRQVRIPMVGTAESLNLAVAAGILLYQVRRPELGG